MITQKSILSFILAFIMCLGLAVPAFAAEEGVDTNNATAVS